MSAPWMRPWPERVTVRTVAGSVLSVGLVAALAAAMFPLRSHLSAGTTGLVLVIPVLAGAAVGGFGAGLLATVVGFLAYDFFFIPPYYTLDVGAAQNWTALGVYGVVMVSVSQLLSRLRMARAEAQTRAAELRRLFDLSELLVRDTPSAELLDTIVSTVREAFKLDGAALLLPGHGRLELAASSGVELSKAELERLSADASAPVSLEAGSVRRGEIQAVALAPSAQPIGLLALRGLSGTGRDHELLRAFANHLALALERVQLREDALRVRLLEEVDRLRRGLVGAVSHDLRTPLATIKVSTSTLLDPDAAVSWEDLRELVALIDGQADRLDRLVANLLDMTRIQSGALELRRRPVSVADLVDDARSVLGSLPDARQVVARGLDEMPPVDVDPVLIAQVMANLIDNATRYGPPETPVEIRVARHDGVVEVAVADRGPGVAPDERETIFQMFNRREAGGRGGLGLAIAHAFLEAHGQPIWVEDNAPVGARFVFTLPVAGVH